MNISLFNPPRSALLTVGKTHRSAVVLGVAVDGYGTKARIFYLITNDNGDNPRIVNAARVSIYIGT